MHPIGEPAGEAPLGDASPDAQSYWPEPKPESESDSQPQAEPVPIPPVARPVLARPLGSTTVHPMTPDGRFLPAGCSGGPPALPIARDPEGRWQWLLLGQSRWSTLADVGIVLFGMLLLEFAVGFLLSFVVAFQGGAASAGPDAMEAMIETLLQENMIAFLGLRTLGAILLIGMVLRWRRYSAAAVGWRPKQLGLDCLLGVGSAVVATMAAIGSMSFASLVFPELLEQMQENPERLLDLMPDVGMFGLVGMMLIVGLWEELVFRGFLMPHLRRLTGSWVAAVVLSVGVFASLHLVDQVPAALISISAIGLVFSLVTIWRRSIVPAIIGHALFNTGAITMMKLMEVPTT
jgi:membrane protease YdiL (CAAX protease family)